MQPTPESSRPSFPLLGDDFPSREVQTTHGPMRIPEDFEGSWFVLFSHPADFNWPHNELIGDRIIVPPPKDIETADARLKQKDCSDWWFCHKPLEKT